MAWRDVEPFWFLERQNDGKNEVDRNRKGAAATSDAWDLVSPPATLTV